MSRTRNDNNHRAKLKRWRVNYDNAPAPAEKRASEALVAGLADTPIDPIDIDDGYLGRLPEFIGKEQTSCSGCGFTSNVPALIAAHDFGHTEDT